MTTPKNEVFFLIMTMVIWLGRELIFGGGTKIWWGKSTGGIFPGMGRMSKVLAGGEGNPPSRKKLAFLVW